MGKRYYEESSGRGAQRLFGQLRSFRLHRTIDLHAIEGRPPSRSLVIFSCYAERVHVKARWRARGVKQVVPVSLHL